MIQKYFRKELYSIQHYKSFIQHQLCVVLQVTRSVDLEPHELSVQEEDTIEAIVAAR